MKYKVNVTLALLLLISCVAVAGLTIDNKNISKQLTQKDETVAQLQNENNVLNQRLYDTMTTKISTATKVIQVQKETLKVDSEDQCKATADKYFAEVESLNGATRSTYRSHWNTKLKACLIEMTIRKTNTDGSVITRGIISYDLTNDKKIMVCSNEEPTENAKSCTDSFFVTFEEMYMSQ
jgi:hypothetical protein